MKRLFLLTLLVMCVVGCQKNIDTPESNLVEVGFSSNIPTISFDDEPLIQTRSYSNEPRYIIQVYLDNAPYAYGVFNDITSQKITMEKGKTYKMKVAYFPNGHSYPFTHDGKENYLTEDFVYSIDDEIYPDGTFSDGSFVYFIPSIKYYAENIEYTASSNSTSINIDLKAWIFGLSFKVKNLTTGTVKVVCTDSFDRFPSLTFTPDNTTYEAIYSMYDNDGFTYTPYARISYVDDTGIETKIYEGDIPTARLKKTIVNINLKPASNGTESSFSVNLEDITITDGETLDLNQE